MASAPLHAVRAGRSLRREGTKLVEAQPQRGLLYLTEDDGLTHFCWKDGDSNATIDDLILFPGDASFRPLPQSPRTCVLRFSSSDAAHFYWLQDPDSASDGAHISAINQLLQAPDDEHEAAGTTSEDVHMDGSRTPTTTLPPSNDRDQLASLLQAFQNEPQLGGQGAGAASAAGAASYGQVPYVLSDVANSGGLAPLLANRDVQQRLFQHLPPGLDHSEATLRSVIHSPEIRRSLSSLDQALRTGALGPLVQSLGLKQDAALSVENFLQAIQEKADNDKQGSSTSGMDMS